jgi:hypothetical protein
VERERESGIKVKRSVLLAAAGAVSLGLAGLLTACQVGVKRLIRRDARRPRALL